MQQPCAILNPFKIKDMYHSKTVSLHFYEYLCMKIGSEKVVRARRLSFICKDSLYSHNLFSSITSGSKGEGLNLKGSDLDIMCIALGFVVYESEKDAFKDWRRCLVMDNEETQPCFTYLQLPVLYNYDILPYFIKPTMQQHRGKNLLSSELFKSQLLKHTSRIFPCINSIHGPCLADTILNLDNANCLKCDHWVLQAQPWITRPRSTWPSPELIDKITSCGVLFVPIGNKGSINENLQWRLSFSIAEKILIFSFSHTQLLCYALLKILLKEIVDRNEDVKGLLCSYFLKTLMFWISEETETSVWRPDNIIPCFMACLQRLIYCIEYSTLLHYFIPDNNLFYLRFNSKNNCKLIHILNNSYQTGIKIFSSSETLQDCTRFPIEITRSVCENDQFLQEVLKIFFPFDQFLIKALQILRTLLHHCTTGLSKCIYALTLSNAFQRIPFALPHIYNLSNKQQYKTYKHDLSQLLVGVHSDAVSGWLKLATFFYNHKNYFASFDIINYSLSKCTDDKVLMGCNMFARITLNQKQKYELALMAHEKLTSVMKAKIMNPISFAFNSSVIPTELKSESVGTWFDPRQYAHLLHFLCCYYLQDLIPCGYCRKQLLKNNKIKCLQTYKQSKE